MVHHSKFLYSALVVSAMAVGANAQVTTSAISGKVLDEPHFRNSLDRKSTRLNSSHIL